MTEEKFNIWDRGGAKCVREAYAADNYEVWDCCPGNTLCILFFSSHGLYYPNTEEVFRRRVLREDRYEWKTMAGIGRLSKYCGRIIYVRDIYKQWYVKGINRDACSVDKVKELLEGLTEGFEVITAGSSAGGYAAMLFGTLLHARRCISLAGQFVLWEAEGENPYLEEGKKQDDISRYYDLRGLMREGGIPVFYFYSGRCGEDAAQYQYGRDLPGLYAFRMDSDRHGKAILPMNLCTLLLMDNSRLIRLAGRLEGKYTGKKLLLLRTAGPARAAVWLLRYCINKLAGGKAGHETSQS